MRQFCHGIKRMNQAPVWIWGMVWFLLSSSSALAHHTSIGSTAGIPIPSLTHGQMAVIAENRQAILDLADQEPFFSDETFFRLRNFVDIQYMYCFRGLVPGSLEDEESPFNECSHAYLSGTEALLLHMRTMKGDQSQVRALIDKIELEMLANHASLVLCRYSDEPFNTAAVIMPHWGEVPFHMPTLLSFLAVVALLVLGLRAFFRFLLAPDQVQPIKQHSPT